MTELLLGCGHSRAKRMGLPNGPTEFTDLVTVDNNRSCGPDIVCNLDQPIWTMRSDDCLAWNSVENVSRGHGKQFKRDYFSEVHAYEVLEHLGRQGDVESFFSTFDNIWHILVPGGYLFASTPARTSGWLWGDPGHTRAILPESLVFLDQTEYIKQCGKTTFSDYRSIYKSDFSIIHSSISDDKVTHRFCLQAIKPARTSL